VACVVFFSFFRLGELLPEAVGSFDPATRLALGDVALDNHQHLRMAQIHLSPFGSGADIILGATDNNICLVTAITQFVAKRGNSPGHKATGEVVTKAWFVKEIRALLAKCGLRQSEYPGHSLRIGAATTAALARLEDSNIQLLGSCDSSAFLLYLRTLKEKLAALSASLASQQGIANSQSHSTPPA